ncbi:MAG: LamG domain-containing protein [Flavobacteriales bacterium]|nr:LamG domain-containing protein [Flavobacteriales bacterium]
MRTLCLSAIALCLPLLAPAQLFVNNALDLDGLDDQAQLANASALVAGAPGMTLACRVKPRNTAPAFPDLDGFCGIRNNVDADLYFIQVGPQALEGRFRNSVGTDFTITAPVLEVGAWQSLALTYDGDTLRMYHDGVEVGSIAASGTITNTVEPLHLGTLPFQFTDFLLNGVLDEVMLWERALSADEVRCLVSGVIDGGDLTLKVHFDMDQGTPGGNNTAITAAIDAVAGAQAPLTGFALNGPGSNFVAGAEWGYVQELTLCQGETFDFGGTLIDTAGTWVNALQGAVCDSLITLIVDLTPVNVTVVQLNANLFAQATNATFQWLDCGNGFAQIPGAVGAQFTATANGQFAVEVTQSGCTDTSACFTVTGVGIGEQAVPGGLRLEGDPASGQLVVLNGRSGTAAFRLVDAAGRVLRQGRLAGTRTVVPVEGLATGPYVLVVELPERPVALRFTRP